MDDEDETGLDVLGIVNMLAEHYHEGYDAVTRWPWRVFCARWTAVYRVAERERAKRQDEEYQRELEALRNGR